MKKKRKRKPLVIDLDAIEESFQWWIPVFFFMAVIGAEIFIIIVGWLHQ